MTHTSTQIRNIALVGHASVGKTTLLEALLHVAGAIDTAGTVERGSTVSDTDSQEIARGHSIDSCVAHLNHGGCHINVIDTPGYADFRGATLSALGAVETAGIVINAVNGIEHGTRRMLLHAGQRGLARVLIINKLDFERTDLAALVAALRAEFGNECLPINLPVGHGRRVLDCFTNTTGETDFSSVADAHQRLLEQIVETDEALMSRYLDGGESALTTAEIHDAFERCLREGHVLPICFVSARTGVGINELLALMSQVLPAPTEGNTPPLQRADGTQLTLSADPAAPLLATVFKIVNDPFLGKLGVFRVWQGTARRDMTLLIGDDKTPCKIAHLLQVQGRTHTEVETALPGDIVAVAKLEGLHLGAVLHDGRTSESVTLASPAFPLPMVGLALSVGTRGNEQKLSTALARLAQEDACFRVEHHKELNETVARGLSELHLKIMLERLRERYGVEVETAPPRIAYRETIAATAEGHHRHKKQTGGAGQFGEVSLRVEPLTRGAGIEFVDAVKGGVIPGRRTSGNRAWCRRRLPAAGSARDRVRRQVPSGGFARSGVCQRRTQGVSRCRGQRATGGAGADREPRSDRPRASRRRHHRQPRRQARAHRGHQHPGWRRSVDPRASGAGGVDRLHGRAQIHDRRTRSLQPRLQPLRGGQRRDAKATQRRVETARGGGLTARSPRHHGHQGNAEQAPFVTPRRSSLPDIRHSGAGRSRSTQRSPEQSSIRHSPPFVTPRCSSLRRRPEWKPQVEED